MATMLCNVATDNLQTGGDEGSPLGAGMVRRASLVLKQTEELLDVLHQEATKSNALMAELEALLASSQAASRKAPAVSTPTQSQAQTEVRAPSQSQVQSPPQSQTHRRLPAAQRPDSSRFQRFASTDQEPSEDPDEKSHEEAPPVPAAAAKAPRARRSSVVIMDGSALFGTSPDAAGAGNGATDAQDKYAAEKYAMLMRGRNSKSWTAGRPTTHNGMRRNALQDAGGPGPGAAPPALQAAGYPSGGSCSPAPGAAPSRMSMDYSFPSAASVAAHSRLSLDIRPRPAGLRPSVDFTGVSSPGTAWPSQSGRPPSGAQSMVCAVDALIEEDEEDEQGADAAMGARSYSGLASHPPTRARSGRFMRLLKGFFHANDAGAQAATASAALQPHSSFASTGSSGQPLAATGSALSRGPATGRPSLNLNRSNLSAGSGSGSGSVNAISGPAGVPVSSGSGGAGALAGALEPARRGSSSTLGGGRTLALASQQQVARGGSFKSPGPGSPGEQGGLLASSLSARPFSGSQNFVAEQSPASSGPQAFPGVAEGGAAAGPSGKATSRRSLVCALPQI